MITPHFTVEHNPYRLKFELPGLPTMTNKKRVHWRVLKRERDQWVSAITILITRNNRPIAPCKKANITLTRYSSVEPDYDGLVSGFKDIIDALRIVGVITDDKRANVGRPEYLWEYAPRGQGKIKVELEEL